MQAPGLTALERQRLLLRSSLVRCRRRRARKTLLPCRRRRQSDQPSPSRCEAPCEAPACAALLPGLWEAARGRLRAPAQCMPAKQGLPAGANPPGGLASGGQPARRSTHKP